MRNLETLAAALCALGCACASNAPLNQNEPLGSDTSPASGDGGETDAPTDTSPETPPVPGPDGGPAPEPPLDPETCLPAPPGPPPPPAVGGPAVGEPGTVVISEIMSRPSGDEEWVELYNATDEAVDLTGCTLTKDTDDDLVLGPLRIEPGSYAVIGDEALAAATPDFAYSDSWSLSSSGETLVLSCAGNPLDSVTFTRDDTDFGAALQLDVRYAERGLGGDVGLFCLATTDMGDGSNRGTPGNANVACAIGAPPAPAADGENEPSTQPEADDCATGEDPPTEPPQPPPAPGGSMTWTCNYNVFGSPACVDYVESDGWTEATALTNCLAQFGDGDGNLDDPATCLSKDPADRCVATDGDTGLRYYAVGTSEAICTGPVMGTFETRPPSGWPAY